MYVGIDFSNPTFFDLMPPLFFVLLHTNYFDNWYILSVMEEHSLWIQLKII